MGINRYNLRTDGNIKLTPHFKVKEFACKDGSDIIQIDDDLLEILESLRLKLGKPITIVSGYRTREYNTRCGGANNSYHLRGMASDIRIDGVSPIIVGLYAASLGARGIGIYNDFTHIDTREESYMWKG